MKKVILTLLAFFPLWTVAQVLTNTSNLNITKTWSQEPNGYTYPMGIRVPAGTVPQDGFPVCILLHGNGGNGMAMANQFSSILECHVLVAPTGYQNSWNICAENSDAPDVEMVGDLVNLLKGYTNIDTTRIRILGSSNGGGLANRVLIENTDPGIDAVCAIVTQLNTPQYHAGDFFKPSTTTDSSSSFCGYNTMTSPLAGRRYLSVCNTNDPIIPYHGGSSVVGVYFLPAEEAAFIFAQDQGYTGTQLISGTPMGNPVATEFSYLSGKVVLLASDAAHGTNATQRDYIKNFFADCSVPMGISGQPANEVKVYPHPAQSKVIIERTVSHTSPFQIFNSSGKVVLTGICDLKTMVVDLSQLTPNVYYLLIDQRTIRLVKQ